MYQGAGKGALTAQRTVRHPDLSSKGFLEEVMSKPLEVGRREKRGIPERGNCLDKGLQDGRRQENFQEILIV